MYARIFLPEIVSKDDAGRKEVLDFIKIFAIKAKDIYPKIVRFYPEPVSDVAFDLDDGMKIYWGGSDEGTISRKLKKLNQVLFDAGERFKAVEYVNLCYFENGRILVKPKKASS